MNRGVRNAFRNSMRTVSITVILGLSIGLALAMLVARQAVGQKITSVKSSIGTTVSISPAGVRGFEGGGDALTGSQLATVEKLAHVTKLTETLNDRLTTDNTNLQSAIDAGSLGRRFLQNNGQKISGQGSTSFGSRDGQPNVSFTPPVTLRGTNNPTANDTSDGGSFKLTNGKAFDGAGSENVAVVGKSLADKNNLTVGSTFTAYNTTITVVGIYDAGNSFSNNQVVMPLKTVQTLSGQADAVTQATATIDSVTNIDSATDAIKKTLGDKADITNSAEQTKNSLQPLENIQTISLYSLIGAVAAGAVIILMTMVMIVRERRREIGVLKAIGAPNSTIVSQFAVEAVTLTMLGAILGTILGALAANPITKMLVTNSTSDQASSSLGAGPGAMRTVFGNPLRNNLSNIHAAIGWEVLLYGLGAALLIAVIGSGIAAYFIAKVRPAEVMRTE